MNIRSLTRGDGVVIGAAVLLFIASFLSFYTAEGVSDTPNAWESLYTGMGVYLGGVVGAALIVVNRVLPQPRKVAGLDLGTVGAAFSVFVTWMLLWFLMDVPENIEAGSGLILGFIAALVLVTGPFRHNSSRSAIRSRGPTREISS
ncbi:hypothetical protein ACTWQO_33810, partial [Streptomyces sp. 4N124]